MRKYIQTRYRTSLATYPGNGDMITQINIAPATNGNLASYRQVGSLNRINITRPSSISDSVRRPTYNPRIQPQISVDSPMRTMTSWGLPGTNRYKAETELPYHSRFRGYVLIIHGCTKRERWRISISLRELTPISHKQLLDMYSTLSSPALNFCVMRFGNVALESLSLFACYL